MSNIYFNHYRKGVVCLDYDIIYESIELAGKLTSCNPNCIRHVCKGRQTTTKNSLGKKLRWMYLKDYVEKYGLEHTLTLKYLDSNDYLEEYYNAKSKVQGY